ncbi:hypothetical protein BDN72DRAFT_865307 [Pluteus cervinus]|uniref:Uncharacterized protein n=1 Tax=Pluteus cervinus TaxID=181527 RepID=A0ACD3A1I4_9AGAR|nr:hypothetical protein BDN72DRAFT_865307 [Pluteus cervinus]
MLVGNSELKVWGGEITHPAQNPDSSDSRVHIPYTSREIAPYSIRITMAYDRHFSRWEGNGARVTLRHNAFGTIYDGLPYACRLRGRVLDDTLTHRESRPDLGDLLIGASQDPGRSRAFNISVIGLLRLQHMLRSRTSTINFIQRDRVIMTARGFTAVRLYARDGTRVPLEFDLRGMDVDVVFLLHFIHRGGTFDACTRDIDRGETSRSSLGKRRRGVVRMVHQLHLMGFIAR